MASDRMPKSLEIFQDYLLTHSKSEKLSFERDQIHSDYDRHRIQKVIQF